jgi:hypothetical protein
MLRKVLGHLTYANVVATLALFIALGGLSYAAITSLPKNIVRSKHIKNRQVKKPDIGRNAVNSQKVDDETLLADDFAPGQLRPGPPGPRGLRGLRGPAGTPAPTPASSGNDTTSVGNEVPLLTVGPIAYTLNCVDQGAGSIQAEVRATTSEAGAMVAGAAGHTPLTGTPTVIAFEFGTTAEARSFRFSAVAPTSGHVHRVAVLLGHHLGASDCLGRVDVDT